MLFFILQMPVASIDYPYRPARVDDNLYQAVLPDLVTGGGKDADERAASEAAAADEGRKGRASRKGARARE